MWAVPIRFVFDLSSIFFFFFFGYKFSISLGSSLQVDIKFCAFPPSAWLATTSLLFVSAHGPGPRGPLPERDSQACQ